MNPLEILPFWDALSAIQQQSLHHAARTVHYSKDTLLHSGSSDCVGLFLVLHGQLRVYTLSEEGRELTLYRLFERDLCLLSASCILQGLQFDVMVSAVEDSDVLHIPSSTYQALMECSLPVATYTNELMASHFSEVMWGMNQRMNQTLDTRLSAFLLEEAALRGSETLCLTHEQIAKHLGSAREVISRLLKQFQNEGLLTVGRGSLCLLDKMALHQRAGSGKS